MHCKEATPSSALSLSPLSLSLHSAMMTTFGCFRHPSGPLCAHQDPDPVVGEHDTTLKNKNKLQRFKTPLTQTSSYVTTTTNIYIFTFFVGRFRVRVFPAFVGVLMYVYINMNINICGRAPQPMQHLLFTFGLQQAGRGRRDDSHRRRFANLITRWGVRPGPDLLRARLSGVGGGETGDQSAPHSPPVELFRKEAGPVGPDGMYSTV